MGKKKDPSRELQKKSHFRLAGIDTRATFLLARSMVQGASKSFLVVTTVIFGGSLTFLGLKGEFNNTVYLKYSWLVLAASVVAHLFVQVAILDSLIAHGRTETDNKRAEEGLREGKLIDPIFGFFRNAFRAHYNQELFSRSANYAIYFFIIQAVTAIVGGVIMGFFIWHNL